MINDVVKINTDKDGHYLPSNEGIAIGYNLMEPKMVKSKYPFPCLVCGETRNAGTRYFGKDKVCQYCIEEWVAKTVDKLKTLIKTLDSFKKDIKKNKPDWDKEAIVESLIEKTDKRIERALPENL